MATACQQQRRVFPGQDSARTVGPLAVSEIRAQAPDVARTPEGIGPRAGDAFLLNLPLSDGATARQDGRTAQLRPGDFVLVDGTRPYALTFGERFDQVAVTIPHAALTPLLADPPGVTAVAVPGDRGAGAVAAGAILGLARSTGALDREAARAVGQRIVELIALALSGVRTPPPSAGRALLLRAAREEVERRLGDPGLSPSDVAQRIGVSTRYLHRLFSESGPSFSRWVLLRRLERARRDLADPLRAHWSIAEIAREHGFRDPSHFARAFRARHGLTPREARAAAVREAAAAGA